METIERISAKVEYIHNKERSSFNIKSISGVSITDSEVIIHCKEVVPQFTKHLVYSIIFTLFFSRYLNDIKKDVVVSGLTYCHKREDYLSGKYPNVMYYFNP